MATDQTRKTGDALILSGQLKGSVGLLSDDTPWSTAVGTIHIVDAATLVPIARLATDVIITPPVTATKTNARYRYVGEPIVLGSYLYEIEVTLTGLPAPLTWPNDSSKFKLTVVKQYA